MYIITHGIIPTPNSNYIEIHVGHGTPRGYWFENCPCPKRHMLIENILICYKMYVWDIECAL